MSPRCVTGQRLTETEWLSLVEKFGVAALVFDEYTSGRLDRRDRFWKVFGLPFAALFFVASTVFWCGYSSTRVRAL